MPWSENALIISVLAQIPGLGPGRLARLLANSDKPQSIIQADRAFWQAAGVPLACYEHCNALDWEEELGRRERELGDYSTDLVCILDSNYPDWLREIACAPQVLYYQGDFRLVHNELCIAIVGTRRATQTGLNIASDLSCNLAEAGVVIISGLARGIDGAAHKGALAAGGGKTIAVLGGGFAQIYPREHRSLARQIVRQGGLLLSEYPPHYPAYPRQFIARNRIVSGLARGVVVVEAPARSGALITANFALEQGREVFVVPGNIHQTNWVGSNQLIKQGACLITGIDDIFQELSFLNFQANRGDEKISFSEVETAILRQVVLGVETVQALVEATEINLGTISYALTNLQLSKFITVSIDGRLLPGPLWSKALIGLQNEEASL